MVQFMRIKSKAPPLQKSQEWGTQRIVSRCTGELPGFRAPRATLFPKKAGRVMLAPLSLPKRFKRVAEKVSDELSNRAKRGIALRFEFKKRGIPRFARFDKMSGLPRPRKATMSAVEPVPPPPPPQNLADATPSIDKGDARIGASALRKASVRLIPLIAIAYGVAYTDRVNISFAALQMNRDLHFSASSYGLGAGLFFLSYAACEIPSNLLLYRFGARRWIARIMFTWGFLAMGMMFVKTPLEFYMVRFLLGMAEAGFFPGVVYYLSQWFPANVRARTVSRFYVALPLSSVFMGGLAGTLLNLQGRLGLAGWQWLFLAEGLPAVILSVVFLVYLPNTPAEASWLTAEERGSLIEQLRADNDSIGKSIGAGAGKSTGDEHGESALRAILNPRVWQLGIYLLCIYIGFYAFSFSAPVLIQQTTGLSNTNVGFVIAVMGILGAFGLVLNGRHSDRAGERYLHLVVPCVLIAAAFVVGGLTVAPIFAIPAYAIIFIGFNATAGPSWAIASSFLTGRSAAAGIATANTIAIVGGFLGPYWMGRAKDFTGNYQTGLVTLAVPALTGAAIVLFMRHQASRTLG
jgi:ACS family tartrate transporter-like MFS transporter